MLVIKEVDTFQKQQRKKKKKKVNGQQKSLTCSAIIPALAYDSRLLEVRPVRVYAYKPPAKAIPGITATLSSANLHADTKPTTKPARNVER